MGVISTQTIRQRDSILLRTTFQLRGPLDDPASPPGSNSLIGLAPGVPPDLRQDAISGNTLLFLIGAVIRLTVLGASISRLLIDVLALGNLRPRPQRDVGGIGGEAGSAIVIIENAGNLEVSRCDVGIVPLSIY